jgi:hypothetical protein
MGASEDYSGQAIMDFCQRVADGLEAAGNCPVCAVAVQVTFSLHGVEVRCPTGCFRFDCNRDAHTGTFVSGWLDFPASSSSALPQANA